MNKKLVYIIGVLFICCLLITVFYLFNYNYISNNNSSNKYPYDTNRKVNKNYITKDKSGNRINNSSLIKEIHSFKNISISEFIIKSPKLNPDEAEISFKALNIGNADIIDCDILVEFFNSKNKLTNSIVFHIDLLESGSEKTIKEKTTYKVLDSYNYKVSETFIRGA